MSKQSTATGSLSVVPSTYVGGTFTTGSSYPPSNGLDDDNSTNYARFTMSTTAQYCWYSFDLSEIPEGATIDSVVCSVKAYAYRGGSANTKTAALYSGTTSKGISTDLATSNTTFELSGGSWTLEEVQNIRLRFDGQRSSSSGQTPYVYFYGATLTVEYTYLGTTYEITSSCSTDLALIDPSGSVDAAPSSSYILYIDADSLDDIKIEDNGTDVTSQLVQHESGQGGTVSSVPVAYSTTGSISGTRYTYAIGQSAEDPSTQTGNDYSQGSGTSASINYTFDFSEIPEGAPIESVEVYVAGHLESTTNTSERAELRLFSGNTQKGSMSEFTQTSTQVITMSAGTWTYEELQNARLEFGIGYYGGAVQGVTFKVNYAGRQSTKNYYFTYTLSDVQADHNIVVSENVIEPPEEDPEKTYYSVTVSSINANTTPGRGTTRVEEGTSETVVIVPLDPELTLAFDNGVDITSQLRQVIGADPTHSVATAPSASYGFDLDSNTGYYVSTNVSQSNSAAVARISLDLPCRCLVTFTYINYAEATYDYGIFGNVDTALGTTYSADSNVKLACNTSTYNSSDEQTLTYEIESGSHFIDVKYRKDSSQNSYNDTLQFKYEITKLETTDYYEYDLDDIAADHSLVFIFGDVAYYFINSSGTGTKLFPAGQMVLLEGENYRLTIIPDSSISRVTLRDNNVDVSSQLIRKEVTTEKDGVSTTVVNYIYSLDNIAATHNLVVAAVAAALLHLKVGNSWVEMSKVYKKQDGRWEEIEITDDIFDPSSNIYVKGV